MYSLCIKSGTMKKLSMASAQAWPHKSKGFPIFTDGGADITTAMHLLHMTFEWNIYNGTVIQAL